MIATEFKLIPFALLASQQEETLRGLPGSYAKHLLEEPEIRGAFLAYALLTHWPQWLNGNFSAEELLANRLYWYYRFSKQYERDHDFEAGYEKEGATLLAAATKELGAEAVAEIEQRVETEWRSNEWETAVAYSEFSVRKIKEQFAITFDETRDSFSNVAPVVVSATLVETLKDCAALALRINTEKARSELIVMPVLIEVRRQVANKISLFSGLHWDIDKDQGLCGLCDFLLGATPEQLFVEAPAVAVVEVKNDDHNAGIAQCLAEMIAARIFNNKNGNDIPIIHGIVTTGNTWRFLRLVENTAYIDIAEYHIKEVDRIVGIIVSMFAASGITPPPRIP